ncbi:MAG: WXG100 family type VII secretion target [Actinomycetes bacterium]
MGRFLVTPEQLHVLSGRVAAGSATIDSELHALRTALAPLHADWTGLAQERFEAYYDEWHRSAQLLQEALAGISQLLSQAGQAYAEAEQSVASSFTR